MPTLENHQFSYFLSNTLSCPVFHCLFSSFSLCEALSVLKSATQLSFRLLLIKSFTVVKDLRIDFKDGEDFSSLDRLFQTLRGQIANHKSPSRFVQSLCQKTQLQKKEKKEKDFDSFWCQLLIPDIHWTWQVVLIQQSFLNLRLLI